MTAHHRLQRLDAAAFPVDDAAFDEALDHIRLLAARLDAVLSLHEPRATLFGPPKCVACRRRWPCPTVHRAGQVRKSGSEPLSRLATGHAAPVL